MSRAVLITRAREQGERTMQRFAAAGWDAAHVPCIELAPPPDPAAFATAAARVASYDWLVLTSQNTVTRLSAQRPANLPKIAAIGPETARAVREAFGRSADLVASAHRGEALAAELLAALGPLSQRVVLFRAERARDVLPTAFAATHHQLDVVVAYAVRPAHAEADRLATWLRTHERDRPAATVVLASSLTVDAFFALAQARALTADTLGAWFRFACISPITARALLAHGVRASITAQEHTLDGLFAALSASAGDRN